MLSVQETAEKLGVSGARVRAMLKSGVLSGTKLGRAWAVSEDSVARRLQQDVHPGRPSRNMQSNQLAVPNVEAAHLLYAEARETLTGCYDAALLKQARTPEEQAFWICVADFFLQQQQKELIKQGVY